jgi:hypothetical protein
VEITDLAGQRAARDTVVTNLGSLVMAQARNTHTDAAPLQNATDRYTSKYRLSLTAVSALCPGGVDGDPGALAESPDQVL